MKTRASGQVVFVAAGFCFFPAPSTLFTLSTSDKRLSKVSSIVVLSGGIVMVPVLRVGTNFHCRILP